MAEFQKSARSLDGDVPAPGGAELNDPDRLSPNDPTIVM
jgi:hypothetical protein